MLVQEYICDKERNSFTIKTKKTEKGKLVERRGRKATSLKHEDAMMVGLPNGLIGKGMS